MCIRDSANTIGNCRTVFCHDPLLRGAIRLNLLTDRVDIVRDLGWRRNTSALTDTEDVYKRQVLASFHICSRCRSNIHRF